MAGALPHYRQGPATYQAGGLILGGQLVSPTAASGAGASTVSVVPTSGPVSTTYPLGVAGSDANALTEPIFPANGADDPTGSSNTLLDLGFVKPEVAVYNNVDIVVNYDGVGAVPFGAKLTWSGATAGSVTIANADTDAKQIIGFCSQPGGVAASSSGRAFISVA